MSGQIFLLSHQNGALVGHMSFQGEEIICSRGFASYKGKNIKCLNAHVKMA